MNGPSALGSAFVARHAEPADARAARTAIDRFEALLLAQAFAPLAKAMGFYGDVVVNAACENVFR